MCLKEENQAELLGKERKKLLTWSDATNELLGWEII